MLHRLASPLSIVLLAWAPAMSWERYSIDPAHSNVGFAVKFTGLTVVEGRFTDVSGAVVFDQGDPTRSSVTALIRTASIWTGVEERDTHLKGADFFDVERFPDILYQSERVERRGDVYECSGGLTMHGVTRAVSFPLRFVGKVVDAGGHDRIAFEASLRLSRKDFGITGGEWWERVKGLGIAIISDEVDVELRIQANRWNFERLEFSSGSKPSIGEVLQKTISEKGIEPAVRQYAELKEKDAGGYEFGPEELNLLGRKLLARGMAKEAVEIFRLNVAANPQTAGAHVALGDARLAAGDEAAALESYRKAVALDPQNVVALEMQRRLTRT